MKFSQWARMAFVILILAELAGWIFLPETESDFTWFGLLLTAGFVWAVLESLRLSPWVAWLAFSGTVLDAASALLQLYSRIQSWDLFMHALGGAVIAAGILELALRGIKNNFLVIKRKEGMFSATMVYLATITIGFLYEFGEYLVDKFQYGEPRSLVSAYDSIEDQLMNIAGATVVLVVYGLWQKKRAADKTKKPV